VGRLVEESPRIPSVEAMNRRNTNDRSESHDGNVRVDGAGDRRRGVGSSYDDTGISSRNVDL
jgi:hypothetical protein